MATFKATFQESDTLNAQFKDAETIDARFGEVQKVSTTNYNDLYNKPLINGKVLVGDKSFEELGDHILSNVEIKALFDRVFKGGN